MISNRATYIFPSLATSGSTKPAIDDAPRTMEAAEALKANASDIIGFYLDEGKVLIKGVE